MNTALLCLLCEETSGIFSIKQTELYEFDLIFFLFSPFYWAGFVAQRERAQQDIKVPYKVPHLTHPPLTYER